MPLVGETEEMSEMKVSLFAIAFGFFLAVGFPLSAMAGPTPGGTDGDGDTVEDAFDNCLTASNSNQNDTDHDGCGDVCDTLLCDLTNDGTQSSGDFVALSVDFGCTAGVGNCSGDCTGDGTTSSGDFVALSLDYGKANGPSGITNPSKGPSCQP
jgi:hypothetical protein